MNNHKLQKITNATILFLFAFIFILTIISSTVYSFVHKRHIPMIIFAAFVFIITGIIELYYGKNNHHACNHGNTCDNLYEKPKKIFYGKIFNAAVFLIPILLYFFANTNLSLFSVAQNIDLKIQHQPSSPIESFSPKSYSNLELQNDTIIMDDDSFALWLSEIYINVEPYIDKKIEISGELWLGEQLNEKEFAIGRLMMVCCAADMQAVGFLCETETRPDYKEGEWIKVKGVLKASPYTYDGIEVLDPFIEVASVEKIEKPKNSFVYPF